MSKTESRNFAQYVPDPNGQLVEQSTYTGKAPRMAAMKAANDGFTTIALRERGTKKVHIYTGERKEVAAPDGLPFHAGTIHRASVKKLGVLKFEHKKDIPAELPAQLTKLMEEKA